MRRLATGISGALLFLSAASMAHADLKVFACFPEWAALAEALGGDRVEVILASSPLENPDYVAPTPGLISSLSSADLIVCTGAHFEDEWLPATLERANNPRVLPGQPGHFLASDYVTLLEVEEGHEEEEGGHLHEAGNPHIQGDPRNVQRIAAQLTKRFIELDPEGEAAYSDQLKSFIADLRTLTAELEAKAAPLKGARIVVQHPHSVYYLNWLGIEAAATVEPEAGVPPGPEHLTKVIDAVRSQQLKFIIYAAYENPAPSRYVAEQTGIPLVKLPFTVDGTDEAVDLFTLYSDTVQRLLDGLDGRERS